MFKKSILVWGLSLLLGVGSAMAHCGVCAASEKKGAKAGHAEDHMKKKMDKMTKKLDLTPDQRTKIEAIKKDKWEKIKAIKAQANKDIKAVLNADQIKKYDKWKAKKKKKKHDKHKGHKH